MTWPYALVLCVLIVVNVVDGAWTAWAQREIARLEAQAAKDRGDDRG